MYNSIEQIKVFYPLQTWEDNKILRKKSEKVDIFDDEIKEFIGLLRNKYGISNININSEKKLLSSTILLDYFNRFQRNKSLNLKSFDTSKNIILIHSS